MRARDALLIISLLGVLLGCQSAVKTVEGSIESVAADGFTIDCTDAVNEGKTGDIDTMGYLCTVLYTHDTVFADGEGNRLTPNDLATGTVAEVTLADPVDLEATFGAGRPAVLQAARIVLLEGRAGSNSELGDEPPIPVVLADGVPITVYQSTNCWTDGVCSDYAVPSEHIGDRPKQRIAGGSKVTFAFDGKPPTEVVVEVFPNGDVPPEQIAILDDGFSVPKEPGIYYYSLSAVWMLDSEKRIAEADSSYAFAVEVVEAKNVES